MKLTDDEKMNFIQNMKYKNRLSYIIISLNFGLASISELAVRYFFKDELLIEPARVSQINSLISIPFIIKPIFGIITDLFPIYGYRRKIYFILCGIFCILSWLSMSFYINTLFGTIISLLIINICLSFSTVLGEATVVELSQIEKVDSDSSAKNYVSLFYFFKNIGMFISAYLKGLLVDIMPIRKVFLIASFLPLLIIIAGFILVEVKINEKIEVEEEHELIITEVKDDLYLNIQTPELNQNEHLENKNSNPKIIEKDRNYDIFLSKDKNTDITKDQENEVLMNSYKTNNSHILPIDETDETDSTFSKNIILDNERNPLNSNFPQIKKVYIKNSNNEENYDNSLDCIFYPKSIPPSQLLTKIWNFICQKKIFVQILLFILLRCMPTYEDPWFYYLTNELKFTASSLGKISMCSIAAILIAIILYKTFFKDSKFKTITIIGKIVSFFFSFMAFLLVVRVNIKMGISDFWFALFSSSFVSMIGQLIAMPMLSLAFTLTISSVTGILLSIIMNLLCHNPIHSSNSGNFAFLVL